MASAPQMWPKSESETCATEQHSAHRTQLGLLAAAPPEILGDGEHLLHDALELLRTQHSGGIPVALAAGQVRDSNVY